MSGGELRKKWNADTYDGSGPIMVANIFLSWLPHLLRFKDAAPLPCVTELTLEEIGTELDALEDDHQCNNVSTVREGLLKAIGLERSCADVTTQGDERMERAKALQDKALAKMNALKKLLVKKMTHQQLLRVLVANKVSLSSTSAKVRDVLDKEALKFDPERLTREVSPIDDTVTELSELATECILDPSKALVKASVQIVLPQLIPSKDSTFKPVFKNGPDVVDGQFMQRSGKRRLDVNPDPASERASLQVDFEGACPACGEEGGAQLILSTCAGCSLVHVGGEGQDSAACATFSKHQPNVPTKGFDLTAYHRDDQEALLKEQPKNRMLEKSSNLSAINIIDYSVGKYPNTASGSDGNGDDELAEAGNESAEEHGDDGEVVGSKKRTSGDDGEVVGSKKRKRRAQRKGKPSTHGARGIRALAEAVLPHVGQFMAKLGGDTESICMVADSRRLWQMHKPNKRASAGSDGGSSVPEFLLDMVVRELSDKFYQTYTPFVERNEEAMKDMVMAWIFAHAAQPDLQQWVDLVNGMPELVDNELPADVPQLQSIKRKVMGEEHTDKEAAACVGEQWEKRARLENTYLQKFSLADWIQKKDWTDKSPMQRVEHLVSKGLVQMILSIATSLQGVSETMEKLRGEAPAVGRKLWTMMPMQPSEAYMLHANPQWTIAVQGDGDMLELLDLQSGMERRPLHVTDRHTSYVRLKLPSNFEELVRRFPADVLRTLDAYGVDQTRWSPDEEASIKKWCDLFPTQELRETAWRTIMGRSNQFAKGGYLDYLTAYAISLLGVEKSSLMVLLRGPLDANGEAEANTGKSGIFAAHAHVHGSKDVPTSYAVSLTSEVYEDQKKKDPNGVSPQTVSMRHKRTGYIDEFPRHLHLSSRQVATLVPHGPPQTVNARDLYESFITIKICLTLWNAFNHMPLGLGTTAVNKREMFLALRSIVTETREAYDVLASGKEEDIKGPKVKAWERAAYHRHGLDALIPPNDYFDSTQPHLFKRMAEMDAIIALALAAHVRLELDGVFPPCCEANDKLRQDELTREAVTRTHAKTDMEEAIARLFLTKARLAEDKAIPGAKAYAAMELLFPGSRKKAFDDAIEERRLELPRETHTKGPRAPGFDPLLMSDPKKASKTRAFADLLSSGLDKLEKAGNKEAKIFEVATSEAPQYAGTGLGNMANPIKGYDWKPC